MRLLADIGGTNARFARCAEGGEILARRAYLVAEADFPSTLARYLSETAEFGMPRAAALAAAGPLRGQSVKLTNADWSISTDPVAALIGPVPIGLFNDLEAVALALPYLDNDDVRSLGSGPARPSATSRMIAINVGTGFGAASVSCSAGYPIAMPSEAGHMSLGAVDANELLMLAGESGFTVEHVLSGPGLLALYRRRCATLNRAATAATAEDVFTSVSADPAAADALRHFTVWLARVARDLVLATASWGGVFLVGSVARSWAGIANLDLFRRHFASDGKMATLLAGVPIALVLHEDPAFLGLARARLA